MRSQFYLTLPSNSSMQIFPDNKTCCYITQLPRTIELTGEWEVAIVEIQYPTTYLPVASTIKHAVFSPNTTRTTAHPSIKVTEHHKAAVSTDYGETSVEVADDKAPKTQIIYRDDEIPSLMFVYCDIIEPRIVGDVYAPLLRILQLRQKADHGDTEVKTFSPAHYLPLLFSSFRTIEISIRDHQGKSIPFSHGTLTVTLHFRGV